MIGGFYFDESVDIENQILYGEDIRGYIDVLSQGLLTGLEPLVFNVPAGFFFQPGQGLTEAYGQDNTAFSLFGTVDYHMTDRLTATVGLNYTQDNKDAYATSCRQTRSRPSILTRCRHTFPRWLQVPC